MLPMRRGIASFRTGAPSGSVSPTQSVFRFPTLEGRHAPLNSMTRSSPIPRGPGARLGGVNRNRTPDAASRNDSTMDTGGRISTNAELTAGFLIVGLVAFVLLFGRKRK